MSSWVAIDFETANENRGSPCAVGLVAVRDDEIVEQYSTCIRPPPSTGDFSPYCVSIHGITAEHVRDAPAWPAALEEVVRFVGGRVVIAHNAAFDVGVIRSACNETDLPWPDLTYACTLVVARRTWPLLSYSLPWVADAAGHRLADHHDARADAAAAAAVMIAAKRVHRAATLPDLLRGLRIQFGAVSGARWKGCEYEGLSQSRSRTSAPDANPDADRAGPFYGLSVCFTGTLACMTRRRAWDLIADAGGQPVAGVSKKTDVLVIGDQDLRRLGPGAIMSTKHTKAAEILQSGHPIEVITEPDFLQRLAATERLIV